MSLLSRPAKARASRSKRKRDRQGLSRSAGLDQSIEKVPTDCRSWVMSLTTGAARDSGYTRGCPRTAVSCKGCRLDKASLQ